MKRWMQGLSLAAWPIIVQSLGGTTLIPVAAARAQILTAEPLELSAPGKAILRWSVEGASDVYISGLGIFPAKGQVAASVNATQRYWLVSEGTNGLGYASLTILVNGSRGLEPFPGITYVRQIEGTLKVPSLPALLDVLHQLLQDNLRFRVSGPYPDENVTVFSTDWRDSPELVGAAEPAIGQRQIAYSVRLYRQTDRCIYAIGTAVQFRRRIESNWYPESAQSPLHRRAADELNGRIVAASAGLIPPKGRR